MPKLPAPTLQEVRRTHLLGLTVDSPPKIKVWTQTTIKGQLRPRPWLPCPATRSTHIRRQRAPPAPLRGEIQPHFLMRPLRHREARSLVQKAHSKAVMEPAPDSQCRVPGTLDSTLQLEAGRSQACAGNQELQLKLRAEKRIPPLQAVGARHSPALAPCLLTPLSPLTRRKSNRIFCRGGKQPRKAGPGCLKNKTNPPLP